MGRTRQYASATERQAAYRARMKATTAWVDRAPYERIENALAVLHDATWRALQHDHPIARELYRCDAVDTLEATVAWMVSHLQQITTSSEDGPHSDVITQCSEATHPKK